MGVYPCVLQCHMKKTLGVMRRSSTRAVRKLCSFPVRQPTVALTVHKFDKSTAHYARDEQAVHACTPFLSSSSAGMKGTSSITVELSLLILLARRFTVHSSSPTVLWHPVLWHPVSWHRLSWSPYESYIPSSAASNITQRHCHCSVASCGATRAPRPSMSFDPIVSPPSHRLRPTRAVAANGTEPR